MTPKNFEISSAFSYCNENDRNSCFHSPVNLEKYRIDTFRCNRRFISDFFLWQALCGIKVLLLFICQLYLNSVYFFSVWCRKVAVHDWSLLLWWAEEVQRVAVPHAATMSDPHQQGQRGSGPSRPPTHPKPKQEHQTEVQETLNEILQKEGFVERVQRPQRPKRLPGSNKLPSPKEAAIPVGQRKESFDYSRHHHVCFHILLVAFFRFGSREAILAWSRHDPCFSV